MRTRRRWSPFMAAALLASVVACGPGGLRPGEGFVDVTGGKVWYRIVGSGTATPLVLLHGGPGFPSEYLKPLERLADERPVIFYDQLGCGRSERPSNPALWQIERFVEELVQLRTALRLDRIHLLGHSWGTMLAVDYMLAQPQGVRSLVLASPALSVPRWMDDANRLRATLPATAQDTLTRHEHAGTTNSKAYQDATMEYYRRYLLRRTPWPPEMEWTLAHAGMPVYLTMWGPSEFTATGNLKDYDRTARLPELAAPTLFTAGRYDEATPETTASYQSAVGGSRLVIFEQSAHLAMLEEPDRYVEVIGQFLRDVERR